MVSLKARVLALGLVLVLAVAVVLVLVLRSFRGSQSASPPPSRCTAAAPQGCGFPDASNTGVPAGISLKTVPGQVSSGTGWSYDATTRQVNVTGRGAVLTGLSIRCNLNITASDVTINDDRVLTAGNFGITIRHTASVTVENSTVGGLNKTSGRVSYAIDDIYGDSTDLVVKNNNVSNWRIGVNVSSGQVTGNYIHDPGYISGDHTEDFFDNGGTLPLTISGNTMLNSLSETTAIFVASNPAAAIANKTITNNLLAGGGYAIYAGGGSHSTSNIIIKDNRFGQLYYPKSGQYGPVTDFDSRGKGNVWSGNVWAAHAQPGDIPAGAVQNNGRSNIVPLP
jgi:hypothetical protein